MAVSGMTVGILCHHWYSYLDSKLPGRTLRIVLQKVILDQLICSPLCISSFFLTLGLLEKSSLEDLKKEVKEKAHRLYIAEWVVWPPAQVINFYFLPTRFRVLYDNTTKQKVNYNFFIISDHFCEISFIFNKMAWSNFYIKMYWTSEQKRKSPSVL